jgi:hypothetical protein
LKLSWRLKVIKSYLTIGCASSEQQGVTETGTVSEIFDPCSELTPLLIPQEDFYQ